MADVYPRRIHQVSLARQQYGDLLDRMVPYLSECDPLADAVVSDDSITARQSHAMVQQALRDGIAAVPQAPASIRELFAAIDHVPVWVDWTRIERGRRLLLRSGLLGGLVLGSKSLVHGYCAPAGNKPLAFSGRLTSQAARRIDETLRFVSAVIAPGGMKPDGEGFAITVKVRLIHAQVRTLIRNSGRWRTDLWSEPINQHDMMGTILLFSSVLLEGLRIFGLAFTREEAEDYMHLWRYVGYLIGVAPELNPTSEAEATRFQDFLSVTQGPPDDDSRALVRALLDSPLQRAQTIHTPVRIHQHIRMGEQLCRVMIGDELADQLQLPRSPLRHIVRPLVHHGIASIGKLQKLFPWAEQLAFRFGQSQWDEALKIASEHAPTDFPRPERIAVNS